MGQHIWNILPLAMFPEPSGCIFPTFMCFSSPPPENCFDFFFFFDWKPRFYQVRLCELRKVSKRWKCQAWMNLFNLTYYLFRGKKKIELTWNQHILLRRTRESNLKIVFFDKFWVMSLMVAILYFSRTDTKKATR